MLIHFTVGNFLSFFEKQTLYMTAVSSCKERLNDNTYVINKKRLLLSTVMYGANASGKSNFYKAMLFFQQLVLNSAKDLQFLSNLKEMKNQLVLDSENKPSTFEIAFFLNNTEFRYGFEATSEAFVKEWLYEGKKICFLRSLVEGEDIIQIEKNWEKARGLEERTRNNALFLSVCATFALPQAEAIVNWLLEKMTIISAAQPTDFSEFTINRLQNPTFKEKVTTFLKNADMNIEGLELVQHELSFENPSNGQPPSQHKHALFTIFTKHNEYDKDGHVNGTKYLPFENHESLGTQKAFALAGPIINALETGSVLVIDELDSRLHPVFTRQIVKMFNSANDNPKHAQLIFNTHDTNLLSFKVYTQDTKRDEYLYRRDQIYFTEKDHSETTHLYSLIEFKEHTSGRKIRNDASFEKDYMNGVYGAIPFIGTLFETQERAE